jgi:hypothetical protein
MQQNWTKPWVTWGCIIFRLNAKNKNEIRIIIIIIIILLLLLLDWTCDWSIKVSQLVVSSPKYSPSREPVLQITSLFTCAPTQFPINMFSESVTYIHVLRVGNPFLQFSSLQVLQFLFASCVALCAPTLATHTAQNARDFLFFGAEFCCAICSQ